MPGLTCPCGRGNPVLAYEGAAGAPGDSYVVRCNACGRRGEPYKLPRIDGRVLTERVREARMGAVSSWRAVFGTEPPWTPGREPAWEAWWVGGAP